MSEKRVQLNKNMDVLIIMMLVFTFSELHKMSRIDGSKLGHTSNSQQLLVSSNIFPCIEIVISHTNDEDEILKLFDIL